MIAGLMLIEIVLVVLGLSSIFFREMFGDNPFFRAPSWPFGSITPSLRGSIAVVGGWIYLIVGVLILSIIALDWIGISTAHSILNSIVSTLTKWNRL